MARVELGSERAKREFRGNGLPMIGIGVEKQSKANTLAVSKAAQAEMEKLEQDVALAVAGGVGYGFTIG